MGGVLHRMRWVRVVSAGLQYSASRPRAEAFPEHHGAITFSAQAHHGRPVACEVRACVPRSNREKPPPSGPPAVGAVLVAYVGVSAGGHRCGRGGPAALAAHRDADSVAAAVGPRARTGRITGDAAAAEPVLPDDVGGPGAHRRSNQWRDRPRSATGAAPTLR